MDQHPVIRPDDPAFSDTYRGLSKREYFAAVAMQGLLAENSSCEIERLAEVAVYCADGLVDALSKV